ncbi:GNAT family N-acetyltransferase [Actinoplanes solisilvae]|uniref:GNAT family N-acetyltransferase n=1 Tax=Actinoplanes solisilvae TaxID=2486853 RepID=UPI0013E3FB2C|nr:GNAT family N-acetyltransferase [Actinoplanes solisilvae]
MILRVGPDEREAFAAAARRFGDGDAGVAGFARSPGALGFVAVEASEVEGWCYGYLMARPDGTSMAYLHNLEVASEHRGRGLGRELLRSFMTAAREAGADKLFLTTGAANIVARGLYESMGGGLATQGPTVSYWFSM